MWVLSRLLFFFILLIGVGVAGALHPTAVTHVILAVTTSFFVWWDRRRARELLLHANLGAAEPWFWIASLLTASLMDLTTQALIGVL